MRKNFLTVTLPICAAILIAGNWLTFGGSLTPPAGPVAGTMKPLSDIEPRTPISSLPYTIGQSGSYYLTGDLTGVAGQHGITISANNVTLDLSGFGLIGVAGSLDGLHNQGPGGTAFNRIVVRNGTIRNWGGSGLMLYPTIEGDQNQFENLRIAFNGGYGLISRTNAIVRGCTAANNGQDGFWLQQGSVITESIGAGNTGNGIVLSNGASALNCSANGNTANGIVASGCCGGNLVRNCTGYQNGQSGIVAQLGSTVTDCVAKFNQAEGIYAASNCLVTRNNCDRNQGAGINVASTGSRIEENHLTENFGGAVTILADVPGINTRNLVIRNTTSGFGEFIIAPGNKYGPIVAPLIDDLSATPAASHPWANFKY